MTFASGVLTLEGALNLPERTPAPGIVVCHPHPMYGGDMHNNVVDAVCQTAAADGIVALRFNFRGAGGSKEATTTVSVNRTTSEPPSRICASCRRLTELASRLPATPSAPLSHCRPWTSG